MRFWVVKILEKCLLRPSILGSIIRLVMQSFHGISSYLAANLKHFLRVKIIYCKIGRIFGAGVRFCGQNPSNP